MRTSKATIVQLAIDTGFGLAELTDAVHIAEKMGRSVEQAVADLKDWKANGGRMPNTVTLTLKD